jgi:hypothetical protein
MDEDPDKETATIVGTDNLTLDISANTVIVTASVPPFICTKSAKDPMLILPIEEAEIIGLVKDK